MIVEGRSGGGLVTVALSGKGDLRGLKIDPSLANPAEIEVLEDLIVAAFNDAKGKSEEQVQRKMSEVTAGLPIPPGMKFPF
jgi:DNA-binding YbaB/EbfC family protein